MTTHEERFADRLLYLGRRCYICLLRHAESATSGVVYDGELRGWLCLPDCYKRAHASRYEIRDGQAGRGRTRRLPDWKALLRELRPGVQG